MRRFVVFFLCILLLFMISSCDGSQDNETKSSTNENNQFNPTKSEDIYNYLVEKIRIADYTDIYNHTSEEIHNLIAEPQFIKIFTDITDISGKLLYVEQKTVKTVNGIDIINATLNFDNIELYLQISVKNLKICGIAKNIMIKKSFDVKHSNGITERYFVIENGVYKLNAVYTFNESSDLNTAVLMIPGSGPSDYNETVGLLQPFYDIANSLAEEGISTLRVDKRTLNYGNIISSDFGVNDEYFIDYTSALKFLKLNGYDKLILLGHSLGGQIAAKIAADNACVDGVIFFNSSARHLADIACDQFVSVDISNAEIYMNYCEIAKNVHTSNTKGYYYFGVNDYYWASYNELDIKKCIQEGNFKSLVVNSTYDIQTFDADINIWSEVFDENSDAEIHIFNDISHYGYKIDPNNEALLYSDVEFPTELSELFVDFCKERV